MSDTTMDPKAIAQAVAVTVSDEDGQVGDFVEAIDLGGYEGWQWSVTLYHDVELDHWTVNESSLVPTDKALRPPKWIPWKDRLEPGDLAVTDSIGTDPDDPRMEEGFRKTQDAETSDDTEDKPSVADETVQEPAMDGNASDESEKTDVSEDSEQPVTSEEDVEEAVEEFDLSRRHVLTPLGRSQTAKRWYEGPHGPKSLSTKTADGNPCSTCGFFIPLKGELNLLFGVCANKWSPDDGRVVSIDHGCGEHSEIDPPEPSHLWVQSKPAFDDMHIDIIAQAPRDERGSVELIEQLSSDDDHNPNEDEEGSDADIEANTIDDDASQEDVLEHVASDDAPEVETTVTVVDENKPETSDDTESADTAEPTESDEPVEQMDETVVEPTAETTGQTENKSMEDESVETESTEAESAETEPAAAETTESEMTEADSSAQAESDE